MAANYDGLTRNTWPGTWSPSSDHPIILDAEMRGGLRYVSGSAGDRLTNITGQRLQEGMIAYLATTYTDGGITYIGGKYYKYLPLPGQVRDPNTGALPNTTSNWSELSFGYTGSIGFVGSKGDPGPQGLPGDPGTPGTSVLIQGSVLTASSFGDPTFPQPNVADGYISQNDGHLWVWDGTQWIDVGQIIGYVGSRCAEGFVGSQGVGYK